MDRTPTAFANALETGDTETVNEAIDAATDMAPADVAAIYDDCFDACVGVYESGDGYVRQSVVRLLRDAYPSPESAALTPALGGDSPATEPVESVPEETLAAQRERLLDFLVRALEDDDGRVRLAAMDGFNTLGLKMNAAGLDDELEALGERLAALEREVGDEKREHVERARQHVDHYHDIGPILSD